MYKNDWIFKLLLINLIIEKIFNKDIMLNYFRIFLNYLLLDLFDAKNTDIINIHTKKAYAKGVYI